MSEDCYDPAALRVIRDLPTRSRRPAGILTRRAALLLQAVVSLPEGEHADVISLIEAGEFAEAAHQMRGGPGDRPIPAEALALIAQAEDA